MKKCATCKQEKSLTEFGKNIKKKDGLQQDCNECRKKLRKELYQKNKGNNPSVVKVKKTNKETINELNAEITKIKEKLSKQAKTLKIIGHLGRVLSSLLAAKRKKELGIKKIYIGFDKEKNIRVIKVIHPNSLVKDFEGCYVNIEGDFIKFDNNNFTKEIEKELNEFDYEEIG
jgi:hypothetical protein